MNHGLYQKISRIETSALVTLPTLSSPSALNEMPEAKDTHLSHHEICHL